MNGGLLVVIGISGLAFTLFSDTYLGEKGVDRGFRELLGLGLGFFFVMIGFAGINILAGR